MTIKTEKEIRLMRTAGLILREAFQKAKALVIPGTMTKEIDHLVEEFILFKGAKPLLKGVQSKNCPLHSHNYLSKNTLLFFLLNSTHYQECCLILRNTNPMGYHASWT